MRTTLHLKKLSLLFLSLLFFVPNGNSKVVYNNSINTSQTEATYPIEKGKVKKKKQQRKKLRKAKLRQSKGDLQSSFWDDDGLLISAAVLSALIVVAGAIFFALGPGSILLLILGIVLISIGLIALFLLGILGYREGITGLGLAMSFLIGLFFLIFGIIAGFPAIWIVGIVITAIIGFIGLGFIVSAIITGSYG
jgi:hypothetical protein